MSTKQGGMDVLTKLHRKTDRVGDRVLLEEILDESPVGVLSTVVDSLPWAVPILIARDADRILLHGSTGAGALTHVAAGAPIALTVTILDGLVISDRQFTHSANYRSAVVRGRCSRVPDGDLARALDAFTDAIIPGRSAECPPHSRKELAQTVLLSLPIVDNNWLCKQRSGPPSGGEEGWIGVLPIRQDFKVPVHQSDGPTPASVEQLITKRRAGNAPTDLASGESR